MGAASVEAGQILEAVAVEGEGEPLAAIPNPDMPEGSVPAPESAESQKKDEAAESQKTEEAAEAAEPPSKKARTSGMSPEFESKFLKLMETTTTGFECTRQALNSVQEHLELLKKTQKDLSDLAAEIHTNRVSREVLLDTVAAAVHCLRADGMATYRTKVGKSHFDEERPGQDLRIKYLCEGRGKSSLWRAQARPRPHGWGHWKGLWNFVWGIGKTTDHDQRRTWKWIKLSISTNSSRVRVCSTYAHHASHATKYRVWIARLCQCAANAGTYDS